MIEYTVYNSYAAVSDVKQQEIVNFLFDHLDEFGDEKNDINKAIQYALGKAESFGGFIVLAHQQDNLIGAVVVNRTGMNGYIPDNILVYIAMHRDFRGKGIGKSLMTEAINAADGDIALHVEPNNPARFLYEKLGFNSKYLEMRYKSKLAQA